MSTATTCQWIRVSKRHPCPICHKHDWCLVSQDGKAAICARLRSDRQAGNAGWLHSLAQPLPVLPPVKVSNSQPIASVEARHTAYTALLSHLSLSQHHLAKLLKRGLTIPEIDALGYKSLPLERSYTEHQLTGRGVNFVGIPGFWRSGNIWRLAGQPGILIPVRNFKGQIEGCQIRLDDTSTGKYRWLSSADKPGGTAAKANVHVAQPLGADRGEVWVTEGPLKADIISLRLQLIVLAVPGVGTWIKAIPIIWQVRPQSVVVAFDMDKLTNETVSTYRNLLLGRLIRMRIRVYEASWRAEFKGLDDLLATGRDA